MNNFKLKAKIEAEAELPIVAKAIGRLQAITIKTHTHTHCGLVRPLSGQTRGEHHQFGRGKALRLCPNSLSEVINNWNLYSNGQKV